MLHNEKNPMPPTTVASDAEPADRKSSNSPYGKVLNHFKVTVFT